MALLFVDSFDHYATADIVGKYPSAAGAVIVPTGGRRGGGCLEFNSFTAAIATRNLSPANATAIVGFAYKTSNDSIADVIRVRSGSVDQVTLGFSGGFAVVYRGTNTAVLGTATTGQIFVGSYNYIELNVTIHPSAGTVVVQVNGQVVLNLTGQNTAASGTAVWDNIYARLSYTSTTEDFDDLYILDGSGPAPLNNVLGNCRVDACYPTGPGSASAWTPSSGANWQCVNDATPNGDTSTVTASAANLTDTYAVQPAPVPGGTIYGVQLAWDIKKSDAGLCSVAPVVHQATAGDMVGTAQSPPTAYQIQTQAYGNDPGTSAPWTSTTFGASNFGLKRTA